MWENSSGTRVCQVPSACLPEQRNYIDNANPNRQNINFDYVFTVCDNAKENCPVHLKYTNKKTYKFRDKKLSFGMFVSTIPF